MAVNIACHIVSILKCHVLEVNTACLNILECQSDIVAVVLRGNVLNGERCKTRHFQHTILTVTLRQHLGSVLGMHYLANILGKVFRNFHQCILQFEGASKQEFGIVAVDELIVAHAAVGLRDGHILEIFPAVLVLYNDFHGKAARAHTDVRHRHFIIQRYCHLLIAFTIILRIHPKQRCLSKQRLSHQLLPGYVHIAQICQRRDAHFAETIIVKRAVGHLVIIITTVVLTQEVNVRMTVGSLRVSLVNHNLMTQRHTTNLLTVLGFIAESLYDHVILLGQHHELHAFLPVTQAVELEVLGDEITRFLLFLLGFFAVSRLSNRGLFDVLGLHDIIAGCLLRGQCHTKKGQTYRQKCSFHIHSYYFDIISGAKIRFILVICAKMARQKTFFCKKSTFGTCFAIF